MKRRFGWVLPVLIALTVVLAAYTIAAAVLLRGLGAYRMGTGLGQVLAVSRPLYPGGGGGAGGRAADPAGAAAA